MPTKKTKTVLVNAIVSILLLQPDSPIKSNSFFSTPIILRYPVFLALVVLEWEFNGPYYYYIRGADRRRRREKCPAECGFGRVFSFRLREKRVSHQISLSRDKGIFRYVLLRIHLRVNLLRTILNLVLIKLPALIVGLINRHAGYKQTFILF